MDRKLKGKSAQATGVFSYNNGEDQFAFSNVNERQVGGARANVACMQCASSGVTACIDAQSFQLGSRVVWGKERKATEEQKEEINENYECKRAFKKYPSY